jgi:hypothetical protein
MTAVQFEHAPVGATEVVGLELRKVVEDAGFFDRLRKLLGAVSEGPLPPLNFVVGDARMYSKEEQKRLLKLPVLLFERLERGTAQRLLERMKDAGIDGRVAAPKAMQRRATGPILAMSTLAVAAIVGGLLVVGAPVWALLIPVAVLFVVCMIVVGIAARKKKTPKIRTPLLRLRSAPAALPASDPWVARLADVLREGAAADVREQVGELALLVQRLVDHREAHAREQAEIDMVSAPIGALVELVEREVRGLATIDAELAELDEGALVRGLAVSDARGEPAASREQLLADLDRLRALEDRRGRAFHRLLEAGRLLRRAVELGLSVRDADVAHRAEIDHALAVLGGAGDAHPPAARGGASS